MASPLSPKDLRDKCVYDDEIEALNRLLEEAVEAPIELRQCEVRGCLRHRSQGQDLAEDRLIDKFRDAGWRVYYSGYVEKYTFEEAD